MSSRRRRARFVLVERGERIPLAALFIGLFRGLASLLGPDARSREWQETLDLARQVEAAHAGSVLAETKREELVDTIAFGALDHIGRDPAGPLHEAVRRAAEELAGYDGIFDPPRVDPDQDLPLEQAAALRAALRARLRILRGGERVLDLWFWLANSVFGGILAYLPDGALPPDEEGDTAPAFRTRLVDLLEDPAEAIERTLTTAFDNDLVEAGLFEKLRDRIDRNALAASGIDPAEQATTRKSLVMPTAARGRTPLELVDAYLGGTPFEGFFKAELPFRIPLAARFEHTHILGGTGHGKTQTLQLLIHRDLVESLAGERGVIVIDSQGDLLDTIVRLACFHPDEAGSLAERLVLIDPRDIEHPPGLNLFDFNLERLAGYGALEREKLLNGTIALYEYMFGALLGAELTQKQGVIFKYLARLMMVIPGATIHTLRELMEDPEAFRPYLEKLEGTTRHFFATQFPARTFDDTRRQILNRLWGVLANPVLERLFASPRNRFDPFAAMNEGKIVLIHTAKDLLKRDGCQILGRFFIALIAQATLERAALPPGQRRPCFVYIDEAHEYFDDEIEDLLNQARKYRVGLVLAHQNLEQLSQRLRATIMASTSVKLAGGVSAKDAATLAREMGCEPEFIQAARKRGRHTEFACWVKNATPRALKLTVPLGVLEGLPRLGEGDYQALLAANRTRYAATAAAAWQDRSQRTEQGGFRLGEHEVL